MSASCIPVKVTQELSASTGGIWNRPLSKRLELASQCALSCRVRELVRISQTGRGDEELQRLSPGSLLGNDQLRMFRGEPRGFLAGEFAQSTEFVLVRPHNQVFAGG